MNDNLIWKIATEYGVELTRSAAFIMLDTGMCTQPAPITDYVVIKNISDAIQTGNIDELDKNLKKEQSDKLKEIYKLVLTKKGTKTMENKVIETNDAYEFYFENGKKLWMKKGQTSIFFLETGPACKTKMDSFLYACEKYLTFTDRRKDNRTDEEIVNIIFEDVDKNGLIPTMNAIFKEWLTYAGASEGINYDPTYEAYKFTEETIKEI